MDYFADVYQKRVNRFGDNIQSRVHGKMEYDFELKLKKSVNRVELFDDINAQQNFDVAIFETNTINETENVNYLCTRTTSVFDNGYVFYTIKPFTRDKQAWMVLYREQYQTIGYNRYVVVLLENELKWIGKDGLFHTSYVHYVGDKEGKIKSNFKINYEVAVDTPSKTLFMICPKSSFIHRDLKMNISDETWRVSGYDKISVPGVMYVTLEEDYAIKAQYANEDELKKWSIISSQGEDIYLTKGSNVAIDFYCTYDGTPTAYEINIECDNPNITINKNGFNSFIFEGGPADVEIVATLIANDVITQHFNLSIIQQNVSYLSIVGPDKLKVMQTLEYELSTTLSDYSIEIDSEKGNFSIEKVEGTKVYLKGVNVGQDNIVLTYNGVKYLTPINVISPWM